MEAFTKTRTSHSKIAVFRCGQLGDTLVCLPALWALREAYPKAEITFISDYPIDNHITPAEVLPRTLIDNYLFYPAQRAWNKPIPLLSFCYRIRRMNFDILAYLSPSQRDQSQSKAVLRDLRFFQVMGIKKVLGKDGGDILPGNFTGESKSEVTDEASNLLARLSVNKIPHPNPRSDWLDLDSVERSFAQSYLKNKGIGTDERRNCVAFGIGAKLERKRWPLERFLEVGTNLIEEMDVIPVVVGGKEDAESARWLCKNWKRGISIAGELNVRSTAAALRNMLGFCGNDTGSMHLAAFSDLRCVGLFSSHDWPGKWNPFGDGHVCIRAERFPDCGSCLDATCRCIENISPEKVTESCEKVIRSARLV